MFADQLSDFVQQTFIAGIQAVSPAQLMQDSISINADRILTFNPHSSNYDLKQYDRIVIVGAGKASGGLARELIKRLLPAVTPAQKILGWINVADNDQGSSDSVRIFPARPVNSNLPTTRVVEGTQQIISLVKHLGPRDLCIAVISGGGSALLCAPAPGLTLEDKQWVGRALSQQLATIEQINQVRRQLSMVKGGRLLQYRTAGSWVTLILSDILGDPLHLIASGPTIPQIDSPQQALETLVELGFNQTNTPERIWNYLQHAKPFPPDLMDAVKPIMTPAQHLLIGNLKKAVAACAACSASAGWTVSIEIQDCLEQSVADTADHFVDWLTHPSIRSGRHALIRGGEPILRMDRPPGRGGRNLHLVLSIADRLLKLPKDQFFSLPKFCLLSAGTDGEDGSAPVAGGWLNDRLLGALRNQRDDVSHYLNSYDAFSFFSRHQTTCEPGVTATNVGDLQLAFTTSEPAFSAVK